MRKHDAIDLIKLYAMADSNVWNHMLSVHVSNMDITGLARIRYQLQAGMDDLAKKKLNNEKMISCFIRWNRSIENSVKQILRLKYPLPGDSPTNKEAVLKIHKERKNKRDQELAKFMLTSSY